LLEVYRLHFVLWTTIIGLLDPATHDLDCRIGYKQGSSSFGEEMDSSSSSRRSDEQEALLLQRLYRCNCLYLAPFQVNIMTLRFG